MVANQHFPFMMTDQPEFPKGAGAAGSTILILVSMEVFLYKAQSLNRFKSLVTASIS